MIGGLISHSQDPLFLCKNLVGDYTNETILPKILPDGLA
jgi:hypothetical protein